jgi:predicted nucleic acid-binding protein
LAVTLRKKGIIPSAADCLIGAAAIQHQVSLIHLDRDFVDIAQYSSLKETSWIRFL